MSSILTNSSAMVALQTMKTINSNLNKVQSEISTGKTVATARDNAAVWSISRVMESDVKAFKGISDSLSLGSTTLTVAREASEKIQSLLTDMKEKIVSAQGENVPREKLQTDIVALRGQISDIVSAAQFSGLNLISGTANVKFLSSLDRSANGVSTNDITVRRQDLATGAGVIGSAASTPIAGNMTVQTGTINNAGTTAAFTIGALAALTDVAEITIMGQVLRVPATVANMPAADVSAALAIKINELGLADVTASASTGTLNITWKNAFKTLEVKAGNAVTPPATAAGVNTTTGLVTSINQRAKSVTFGSLPVASGDGYGLTMAGATYNYVAGHGETVEDVARGLKIAIDSAKLTGVTTNVSKTAAGIWQLHIDNNSATAITAPTTSGSTGGTASGGLFGLDNIDVTTTTTARSALENIETMIDRAIDAASEFGSAQGRIDIQRGFVSSLTDALTAGIGTLVDANMEEASARLQALQVQQQLSIQALSIANQQPQNLLALFR